MSAANRNIAIPVYFNKCGQPTCLVFASLAVDGRKTAEDCPDLTAEQKKGMDAYLSQFQFNW